MFLNLLTFFFKFYSIKPSHFTETKIDVKLDPKSAHTANTRETPIEKKENIHITNSGFVI